MEKCSAAKSGAGGGEGFAGSSPPAGRPLNIRFSASKTLKARLYTSSSVSTPTFLTTGFQILSGIHAGAPLGLSTGTLLPVNTCSFFVPRSRSLMSVWPRLAAFRAAWRKRLGFRRFRAGRSSPGGRSRPTSSGIAMW